MASINKCSVDGIKASNKSMQLIPNEHDCFYNTSVYENNDYEINMSYPSKWNLKEKTDPNNVVIFCSPSNKSKSSSQLALGIFVEDLSFMENISSLETFNDYSNILLNTIKNQTSNILKSSYNSLDNNISYEVIYDDNNGSFVFQEWTIKNDNAYLIIFTADYETYLRESKLVNALINSIDIK